MKQRYWWGLGAFLLCVAVAAGVRVYQDSGLQADYISEEQQDTLQSGLTLNDVTLEQQDDDGQLLWRLDAEEITYSPDQKSASLTRPEGELYQGGQLLYRFKADIGMVRDDGQAILLRDNIVATGVLNRIVLRGNSLDWLPQENVMVMDGGLTGTHPELFVRAQTARVYDLENRMQLDGKVIARTVVANPREEPWLKLQGDQLKWNWQLETLGSDQPLRAERFQSNQVAETLTGEQGLAELGAGRVTMSKNVAVQIIDIPLVATSDRAIWNLEGELIVIDRPVEIINEREKLTLTASQGRLDLAEQIVYLSQDVLVLSEATERRLATNQLTWNLADQTLLAEGNVNYRQRNPNITVKGPRAKGHIIEQTIVMDGGRVVTEIVPVAN